MKTSRCEPRLRRCGVISLSALLVSAVFSATPARGGLITTLFNTGVANDGTILADATVDPHYTQVQSADPNFQGSNAIITDQHTCPFTGHYWMPDSATSKWISPRADQSAANDPGMYAYETTFDLTGLNLASVVIDGNWATDNPGMAILLNGQDMGFNILREPTFEVFHPFMLTSGFVAGINTLVFELFNNVNPSPFPNPNPVGLRVEITGTGSPISVPEPGSFTLFALGAFALLGCARRFGTAP